MEHLHQPRQAQEVSEAECLALLRAYLELLCAHGEAVDRNAPPNTNPVPWSRFQELAVADELLVWIQYQGHVEHLRLRAGRKRDRFVVSPANSVMPGAGSCFALTEAGERFFNEFLAAFLAPEDEVAAAARSRLVVGRLTPSYDGDKRLLAWGAHVLKHFRLPSPNQELLLQAAEEQGWPERFDDPLPPQAGTNPKVRLHDTIKNLNKNQKPRLLRFKGDGTGQKVEWEYRQ